MQFDSLTFVLFLALVLGGAAITRGWSGRKTLLLVASYVFYAAWSPVFTLLLAGSSVLDWLLARGIHRSARRSHRRTLLVVSLVSNLGVLALFKYGPFLHANLALLFGAFGLQLEPWRYSLVLPVGISFYTFQSLSYTIDVYRGKVAPIRSLRDFCLFVAFFPQLVAGPIVRFETFAPQLVTPRGPGAAGIATGSIWLLWGLFEKIVLADGVFAPVVDAAWSDIGAVDATMALSATLGFAAQIFCDFAGYSCCAIGAARCLGFSIPLNFRNPYAALGFQDFWRRWHISLSSWLRDYLYVPLGGSRHGAVATARNIMITMLLGGLWHGAGWNFVLWGAAHGLLLVFERVVTSGRGAVACATTLMSKIFWGIATLLAVILLWIPFRAPDATSAAQMMGALGGAWGTPDFGSGLVFSVFAVLILVQWLVRDKTIDGLLQVVPGWFLAPILAGLLVLIVMSPGDNHAFIYFQF
ncbi:MAG: MBOAT family protein [Xanthomonadales bacterium]|nr:MBOAT family protein [Xanthomonadales bacterium]